MIRGPKNHPQASTGRGASSAYGEYYDDDWEWRSQRLSRAELGDRLAPIVRQLTLYDDARIRLETRGGNSGLLSRIMDLLKEGVLIPGRREDFKLSLTDQAGIRRLFQYEFYPHDIRLEVRRRPTGMPVYYLARVHLDYRSEYSLVIEDLFRSPDYPVTDERFAKLMRSGHEVYFLRLSQFRAALLAGREPKEGAEEAVDDTLLKVGRHVFQACWHEDQLVGMAAAGRFGLEHFRRAVELLYLGLTAELCELRSAVSEEMLRFFKDVYVQPAILAFLEKLAHLDGKALAGVPQTALKLYPKLSHAFGRFLATGLPWGRRQAPVPLSKLLFANFSRLEAVREALAGKEELAQAVERLEEQAEAVIDALLANSGDLAEEIEPGRKHLRVAKG